MNDDTTKTAEWVDPFSKWDDFSVRSRWWLILASVGLSAIGTALITIIPLVGFGVVGVGAVCLIAAGAGFLHKHRPPKAERT